MRASLNISTPTPLNARAVFGSHFAKDEQILGWTAVEAQDDPRCAYLPRLNPDYAFRKESLRSLTSFLTNPQGDAMFIAGPTGSGKTSLVLQVAARLNWHVREVACNERLEFADLVGSYVLSSDPQRPDQAPVMKFRYGMLPSAMKHGDILLLNEVDMADPGQMSALNTVLEGGALEIRETGEVIMPHPMFRIICTGNSVGQGDASGRYQGVLAQNLATMDRYRCIVIDYPEAKIEEDILGKIGIPPEVIEPMLSVVKTVRTEFLAGHLSVTFSTRTLIRWARLICERSSWKSENSPISHALEETLLNRVGDVDEKVAIKKQVEIAFPEGTPLKYLQ